jgi:hypothetical protein
MDDLHNKGYQKWLEVGYQIFSEEGLEGLQVERLARILQLNKSGFYHYFGDRDTFIQEICNFHKLKLEGYIKKVKLCQNFVPDYITLVYENKNLTMAHVQLMEIKTKDNYFYNIHVEINNSIDKFVLPLWADYLDLGDDLETAQKFWWIVRDAFYSRFNPKNYSYAFILKMAEDSKSLIKKMITEE